MPGDGVLNLYVQMRRFEFRTCPLAALGCAASHCPSAVDPFVAAVLDAVRWIDRGQDVRLLCPEPTQALIDGVQHVFRELDVKSEREMKDRNKGR